MARNRFRLSWPTILLFLSVVGPGIITANVDNDAGGITTYSQAGAQFGYLFLWTLIPITLALIIVQEMSARMGAVTGKGLSDLIRESFGVKATVGVLIALIAANLGNTAAEFAGIASSAQILGAGHLVAGSKYLWIPVAAFLVWWLVVKGTYTTVERVFLVASGFYVTYLISGAMANPPWGEVTRATFVPAVNFTPGYVAMLIGVVGTTIAPWMQFYIQSAVVEKRVTADKYPLSRIDVIVGCLATDIVAFFIIVACAATLHVHGITNISDAGQAAAALAPLAGKWASLLFALGLLNASVFSAAILPLSTAYYVCEGMGWESGAGKTFREAPAFFVIYTAFIGLGALAVLLPGAPLVPIMFWSQVANGVLLPFILIYMLFLVNDRRIMGDHANGRAYNMLAWATTVIMIVLTILWVVTTFFPHLLGG